MTKKIERPDCVEISFGTIFEFRVKKGGHRRYEKWVIIDTGEDHFFYGAPLLSSEEDGGVMFALPGTVLARNFGNKVGTMTKEEVIKAASKGLRERGGIDISKRALEILNESAQKGPRILDLRE